VYKSSLKNSIMLIGVILCLTLIIGSTAFAQETTISFGHYNNEYSTAQLVAETFDKLVSERTGGEIGAKIYPGTMTQSPEEGLQFCQAGTVDIYVTSSGHLAGYYPHMQFFSLPYLFNNTRHYNVAHRSRPIQEILEGAEEKLDVKIVGMWSDHNGFAISSTKPIRNLEDSEKVKIRCMQNPLFLDMYEAWGFDPTPTDWGEVYTSLQTGLIQANDLGVYGQYLFNFAEVIDAMAVTNHYWSQFIVVMNRDKFNSLSEENQQIVQQSLEEAIEIGDQYIRAKEDAFIERAKEQGKTVTYPDLEPWKEASQAVYDKWFEKYPQWEEWYQSIQNMDPLKTEPKAVQADPDYWKKD